MQETMTPFYSSRKVHHISEFKLLILFFVICCIPQFLHAQNFKARKALFTKTAIANQALVGLKQPIQQLVADTIFQQQVLQLKPDSLVISLPIDGAFVTVELKKSNVFADGAAINELDAKGIKRLAKFVNMVHYRGKVVGEQSLVGISFFADEITGVIDRAKGTWNIGHKKNQTEANSIHYLFNSDDIQNKQVFNCFTDEDAANMAPKGISKSGSQQLAVGYPVDLYIETDYQTYVNNNYRTDQVTKWVAGVMNLVESIYFNEDIVMQVKTLNIWTATDPYVAATTTTTALALFASRMASGFAGDLAHLFSQRDLGGGRAYIDALCDATISYRTGVTGNMDNSFLPINDYDQNISIVTHEIGHNLGSPHTHKCGFWANGVAIDSCGPQAGYPEGTCNAPLPASGGGTIMSYCHLTTGIRLSNGFGTQPGNLIRARVQAATCTNNCAGLQVSVVPTNATCASLGSAAATVTGGTAPFTYLWSNGATTASVSGLAKGRHYVTVSGATAGCQVIQGFDILQTAGACPTVNSFLPAKAATGTIVTIQGSGLSAATAVSFGGTPAASFSVLGSTQITAVVGAGANEYVTVTSAGGTGSLNGFGFCSTTSSFMNPTDLGSITAPKNITGNNFNVNCITNTYSSASTPGAPSARPGNNVFYKFITGPCVFSLDIDVCPGTGEDSYLSLLNSTGGLVLSNDNTATTAGCSVSGASSLKSVAVTPNTTYYIVIESYSANRDISWSLSLTPNACTPPAITSFTPVSALRDSVITINGNYFTDASAVRFNGIGAVSYTVISDIKIEAKIPSDAASGRLSVTTRFGTAFSVINFTMAASTAFTGGVKLCPGGSTVLIASNTGAQYKWQVSNGDGMKDIINNANYAGATSKSLTITNAPSFWYNYQYQCLVDDVPAGNPVGLQFANSWWPLSDNAWETLGNWGCAGKLPDANTDVVIVSGSVELASNAFARSVSVSPGAGFIAKQGFNLGLGYLYQNVPINRLYGGSGNESASSIIPLADGGWIMAATTTTSFDGDISSSNKGGSDCWIVKMDGTGRILWNRLIGGSGNERAVSIKPTPDGGYILTATSTSAIIGFSSGYNKGGTDVLVAKLDSEGYTEWNKFYGGSATDEPADILLTPEGGYMVAASTYSSASADVTGNNKGSADFWVMKLNATGSIVWQKLLGGNLEDRCKGIVENEGGYILAGHTYSSANGDVTAVNKGSRDFWLVKIGTDGNVIWNKSIGGNGLEELESIYATKDGGFVMAGLSGSTVNGDVTASTKGSVDYWIVKCNVDGTIQWNKLYGGSQAERATSIRQTADGGYIVAGFSGSSASGNVTGSLVGAGTYDYWVIKLDASGNLTWNKLVGGNGYDQPYSACQTQDGNFLIGGFSSSTNSGQLTGVITKGGDDCWIIKLNNLGNPL